MSLHSHQDYSTPDQPEPRSINFSNPGTIAHVVDELEANLRDLHMQRDNLENRHAEECAQFDAAHGDTMARIGIIDAGLARYWESQQVKKADASEPGPTSRASQTMGR